MHQCIAQFRRAFKVADVDFEKAFERVELAWVLGCVPLVMEVELEAKEC